MPTIRAPAGALSLDQQRLLKIAQAHRHFRLPLLDKPAVALQLHGKQPLAAVLRNPRDAETSMLVIEHDMDSAVGLVDPLAVVKLDEKIVDGIPAAIQRDLKVIEAFLEA